MSSGPASFVRAILSRRPSWTDLRPRLISAAVLLAIAAIALFAGGYVFAASVGAAFAGAYREWETMLSRQPMTPLGWVLVGAVALSALAYPPFGVTGTATVIGIAALLAVVTRQPEWPWRAGGLAFLGLAIVAAMGMRGETSPGIALGVFLCVVIFVTDSAAFFTGRQLGGEKLAPGISPSKTWSGALGGLLLGTVAGALAWPFLSGSPWWLGVVFSALLSVTGQVGDLVESAIKRRFRIKDSGDIIPGHGGLMDRLDSLTFGVLLVFLIGLLHGGPGEIALGFLNW